MFRILFFLLIVLCVLLLIICKLGNIKPRQLYLIVQRLLVDVILRRLVDNYDKQHGKLKNARTSSSGEVTQLEEELAKTKNMNRKLLEEKNALNASLEEQAKEMENVIHENEELKETNEIFSNSIEDLQRTIKTLTFEANQRIVKKIPPKKMPSDQKVLYAEPDPTGTILRKVSTMVGRYSLFKLELMDENVYRFSVLNNEATAMYISNRSISLLACQIVEVAPNPTRLELLDYGTAVKHDNNWIVMEPVKIKIV